MISVATARGWLGVADTDANNTLLEGLIERVTAALGHELGRYLGTPEETAEIRDGGVAMIVLHDDPTLGSDGAPLASVATRSSVTSDWEAEDEDNFVLEGRALRHGSTWPEGRASVCITYTRGYEADDGPADLRNLVLDVVDRSWKNRATNSAMQSESMGDYSYTRRILETADNWTSVVKRWGRKRA